jgi:hypothetical protein
MMERPVQAQADVPAPLQWHVTRELRWRQVVQISAWSTLVLIGALLVMGSVPQLRAVYNGPWLEGWPLKVLVAALVVSVITLWVGAVVHAAVATREGGVPRPILVALLIVGQFIGGLLYYFAYLRWQPYRDVLPPPRS